MKSVMRVLCVLLVVLAPGAALSEGAANPPKQWSVLLGDSEGTHTTGIATETASGYTIRFIESHIANGPSFSFDQYFKTLKSIPDANFSEELKMDGKETPTFKTDAFHLKIENKRTFGDATHEALAAFLKSLTPQYRINGQDVSDSEFEQRVKNKADASAYIFFSMFNNITKKRVDINENTRGQADLSRNIFLEHIFPGFELTLSNKQESNGGKTIHWDWKATNIGKERLDVTGSRADGNPIVFGPMPELKAILVLNDQQRRREPKSKDEKGEALYPWLDPNAEARVNRSPDVFTRRLVLIGENLDDLDGKTPISGLSSIAYSPLEEFQRFEVVPELAKLEDNRLDYINEGALKHVENHINQYPDALVLTTTATLKASIDAQEIPLTADLVNGRWPLLFGDHKGQIRIIRLDVPAVDDFATTIKLDASDPKSKTRDEVANPILFRDEIELEAEFDFEPETADVTIVLEGAVDNEGVGSERNTKVMLKRVEGEQNLFRSTPLIVADAQSYRPKSGPQSAKTDNQSDSYEDIPENRALAWGENRFLRPRFETHMMDVPLPDAQVIRGSKLEDAGEDTKIKGLFNAALKRAGRCYPQKGDISAKISNKTERDGLIRSEADTLSASWTGLARPLKLTYGQHAAFIMLRDQYVKTIGPVKSLVAAYYGPNNKKRREDAIVRMWYGNNTPLSPLTTRHGKTLHEHLTGSLSRTGSTVSARQPDKSPGVMRYQSDRINTALKQMLDDIDQSVAFANQAGDCDVPRLMLFAGHGMNAMVRHLQSIVTIEEKEDNIVRVRPDVVARRELQTAAITRDIFNAYGAQADAIKNTIKLAGAAISLGLGAGYGLAAEGGKFASFALNTTAAISTTDFLITAVDNVVGYNADQDKLNVAYGAASIFGKNYLQKVKDSTTSVAWRGFDVAAGAFGAYSDVTSALAPQAKELSRIAKQGDDILKTANRRLENYGDFARKAGVDDFKQTSQDFLQKLKKDPINALGKMDGTERQAVEELLGTPPKYLTNKYKKLQKEIRKGLENPDALLSTPTRALEWAKRTAPASLKDLQDTMQSVGGNTTDPVEALDRFRGNTSQPTSGNNQNGSPEIPQSFFPDPATLVPDFQQIPEVVIPQDSFTPPPLPLPPAPQTAPSGG